MLINIIENYVKENYVKENYKDEISPQFAYYLILNTTDIKIRRKLLNKIVNDSKITLMFLLNCIYEDEMNASINYILYDPYKCLELLITNKRLDKIQKNILITAIIKDLDATKDMLDQIYLEEEYKKNILNLYDKKLFKEKSVSNYFNNWNLFGNIIGSNRINDLVLLLINSNDKNIFEIDSLLLYCKLTEKQKDILNAKKISILLG